MSCDNLLTKWLAFYDPIHRGFTPRGIANGGITTVGWSFPRIKGGLNLYRGTPTANDVDFTDPVGAAGFDGQEIRNFSWRNHQPSTTSQAHFPAPANCHHAFGGIGPGPWQNCLNRALSGVETTLRPVTQGRVALAQLP